MSEVINARPRRPEIYHRGTESPLKRVKPVKKYNFEPGSLNARDVVYIAEEIWGLPRADETVDKLKDAILNYGTEHYLPTTPRRLKRHHGRYMFVNKVTDMHVGGEFSLAFTPDMYKGGLDAEATARRYEGEVKEWGEKRGAS